MTELRTDSATTNAHEVEIINHGHALAAAEVNAPADRHPTGTRARLVHGVLDLPDVQLSDQLQADAPIGDTESIGRIRQRTTDMRTHTRGWTSIIDADLTALCDCAEPVASS